MDVEKELGRRRGEEEWLILRGSSGDGCRGEARPNDRGRESADEEANANASRDVDGLESSRETYATFGDARTSGDEAKEKEIGDGDGARCAWGGGRASASVRSREREYHRWR